ncbi:hypothetical protein PAAG_08963 [Paracoccidioides lutzii Pb01]|uniref:Uncharacterized protein n=1 Tax=Paracoccidioides lutzii (strain ATCC MYA-826 / Pb01) TaxID=502779 RepID=C1HDX0_PARBA|nr:hypothetical protein PAAG_08963 [Paracoccidioides lutzii Pb01]EEH40114.2 hypothetical protein PAAG_08963 [Paracoccidioides lutzii Pb01]
MQPAGHRTTNPNAVGEGHSETAQSKRKNHSASEELEILSFPSSDDLVKGKVVMEEKGND